MKIKMETVVSNILRFGVISSAAVTLIGGILYLTGHLFSPINYTVFQGTEPALRSVGDIIKAVASLDSKAIIQLGVILLIATPLVRVVVTLLSFIKERDRIYIGVTAIVLIVLMYSLFGPVLR